MADPLTEPRDDRMPERTAPAFDFVVERGKAAEFARATGTEPRDDGLAPVTFLAASALWMAPENSAWHGITRDFRRVLHGEHRFDYPRGLPTIGTAFRARQRFGRRYDKPGRSGLMHFTEVVTSFWTADEDDPDAVMTSLSITLPEAPAAGEAGARPRDEAPPSADRVRDPLTITDFVRYQGASGDFNPIHHDAGFAASAGLDSPFAVGMLTAGLAASAVEDVRDTAGLTTFRTRWKARAWPGDRLGFSLRTATDRSNGIDVVVTRPGDEVHMLAWADFA